MLFFSRSLTQETVFNSKRPYTVRRESLRISREKNTKNIKHVKEHEEKNWIQCNHIRDYSSIMHSEA